MTPQVHVVNSLDQWQFVQWTLRAADWIAFDVETTSSAERGGLEEWHPDSRIVSVAFAVKPDEAWVIPLAHPERKHDVSPAEVFDTLVGYQLVGAFVKFDGRWAHAYSGVDLSDYLAWDTGAAAFLLNENQALGLKERAVGDLGVEPWDDKDAKTSPDTVPLEQLARYNGLDAAHTFALMQWQRDKLRHDRLGMVMWYVLMPAIRALCSIEQEGMYLDLDWVRQAAEEADLKVGELERELMSRVPRDLLEKHARNVGQLDLLTGDEVVPKVSWAPTSKFFMEFAERAGWPVLERTEEGKFKGRPRWPRSVLKRVAGLGYPDAQLLMEQRVLRKRLDAFLIPWQKDAAVDGKLHPTYNPTRYETDDGEGGTVTGRTSCEKPNLQQVARAIKQAFVGEEGWHFLQADESQIEVRIVAHVSGDENLRGVYVRGGDVYKETAAGINGISVDEVDKDMRQRTKPVVLGFLYGMGFRSFVDYARDTYGIVYTLDEAEHVRTGFFDLFPGLLDWHERTRRWVRAKGYVDSPIGRRRRVPDALSNDRTARARAERQAINAEIQSFASDIMVMSLARIREEIPRESFRSVGTVHDSALGYLFADEYAETVARKVGEIMVTPDLERFGVELSVPLAADVEWGPRWGVAEHSITVTSTELREARAA